jgi:hypothetical protein
MYTERAKSFPLLITYIIFSVALYSLIRYRSAFGAAQAQAPQPLPSANLAGFMSYSSLPSDQKNSVDSVYQTIMNHKRTILAVSTMAPKLLDISIQQADEAAGQKGEVGLIVTVQRLTGQVHQLEQQLKSLHDSIMHTRKNYETT